MWKGCMADSQEASRGSERAALPSSTVNDGGEDFGCQCILSVQHYLHGLYILFETASAHKSNSSATSPTAELFVFILCKMMFLFLSRPPLKSCRVVYTFP